MSPLESHTFDSFYNCGSVVNTPRTLPENTQKALVPSYIRRAPICLLVRKLLELFIEIYFSHFCHYNHLLLLEATHPSRHFVQQRRRYMGCPSQRPFQGSTCKSKNGFLQMLIRYIQNENIHNKNHLRVVPGTTRT